MGPIGCRGFADPYGVVTDGLNDYESNSYCLFVIQPIAATSITLTFSQVSMESGYDFVKVYDGDLRASSQLLSLTGRWLMTGGRLCKLVGIQTECLGTEPITASSGKMIVLLTSDSATNDAGFYATYATGCVGITCGAGPKTSVPSAAPTSPPVVGQDMPLTNAPQPSGACSGILTFIAPSGELSDGEGQYLANSNCRFAIIPQASVSTITLNFLFVSLEASYDFVRVYDGLDTTSPLLATVTGAITVLQRYNNPLLLETITGTIIHYHNSTMLHFWGDG